MPRQGRIQGADPWDEYLTVYHNYYGRGDPYSFVIQLRIIYVAV